MNNDEAARRAKEILADDLKKRRSHAIGFSKENLLGLFNSRHRTGSLDDLGLPFTKLIALGAIITFVLYVLSYLYGIIPGVSVKLFIVGYLVIVGVWALFQLYRLNKRIDALATGASKKHGVSKPAIASYVIFGLLILTVVLLLRV